LVGQIRGQAALSWAELLQLQLDFLDSPAKTEQGMVGRYKQWLGMLTQGYSDAPVLWDQVKKIRELDQIRAILHQSITA